MHLRTFRFTGGQETEQGPRGLRCRRRALPGQRGIVVTTACLAPAAAGLLHSLEPGNGIPYHRLLHVEADTAQAGKDLPGTVQVIDAPATDPASMRLLRRGDEPDGTIDLRMADAVAEMTERFEDTGGNVGT